MKKVGILTFHFATNYGAVLQAYALYKTINDIGFHADIINYVPEGYSYPIFLDSMVDEQKKKREKFNRFLNGNCGISTPMVRSVAGNMYDVYLVGSDQVWNTDLTLGAKYEYFLPNLNDEAKRIAYSASIGMDIDKIDRKLFQKYLTKFDAISLRERSYQKIISELSGKECECTLDPAMLLSDKDYELLEEKPDAGRGGRYLLCFWYNDGGLKSIETINALARKYELSVKHTFSPNSFATSQMLVNDGGYMFHDGIGEFLWHIKNAEVVVTNSFHAAVFALLFKRPLYIFYPEKGRCRQENLVELFQLQDRVIRGYVSPDCLNLEMDYTSIFSILEKEKERSLSCLKNMIEKA